MYETWRELSSLWVDDQAILVGLISRHFSRNDAKAWEGYLVLLTPSIVPTAERQVAVDIQRDTVHLRKLFAAAGELPSVDAVRQTLLPLLPLEQNDALKPRDALDSLPSFLVQHGVDEGATRTAIRAFLDQRPIIEDIHGYLMNEGENPKVKIKSVEMSGFRAFAGSERFDLDGDVVLVVGANGQGKTSLFDAIFLGYSWRNSAAGSAHVSGLFVFAIRRSAGGTQSAR